MGIMQQLGARATLLTVNMITLIFSCILIFYGTTGIGPALRERPCVFSSRQAAERGGVVCREEPDVQVIRAVRIHNIRACMLVRLLQPRARVRGMAGICESTSRHASARKPYARCRLQAISKWDGRRRSATSRTHSRSSSPWAPSCSSCRSSASLAPAAPGSSTLPPSPYPIAHLPAPLLFGYMCMRAHTGSYTHTHTHKAHKHTQTHTNTHKHTQTHTHTHTHTHTCVQQAAISRGRHP